MTDFLKLIRIRQWVKNGFIFFPAFFASSLLEPELLLHLTLGFLAFSLTASAVYIMNDWFDAPLDRLHPDKQHRPIASGNVSISTALTWMLGLLTLGFVIAALVDSRFSMIIMIYFGINLVYSAGLKNFPVLDVAIVSFGFILRIIGGGEIADVPISKWMIIVTFGLSMFLALAKRRSDYKIYEQTGEITRKVIGLYSNRLLNFLLITTSLVTVVCYVLYTLDEHTRLRLHEHLYVTSIPVLTGILRYFDLTFRRNLSGKPTEVLYTDRILQLIIAVWVALLAFLIYA